MNVIQNTIPGQMKQIFIKFFHFKIVPKYRMETIILFEELTAKTVNYLNNIEFIAIPYFCYLSTNIILEP